MPVVSLPLFRCSKPKEICRWRNKGPALLSEFGCPPLRHGPPDSAERARRTASNLAEARHPRSEYCRGNENALPERRVGPLLRQPVIRQVVASPDTDGSRSRVFPSSGQRSRRTTARDQAGRRLRTERASASWHSFCSSRSPLGRQRESAAVRSVRQMTDTGLETT